MFTDTKIDAQAAWRGDSRECRRLYKLWTQTFSGNFRRICAYYGWKPGAMLSALRLGKASASSKNAS